MAPRKSALLSVDYIQTLRVVEVVRIIVKVLTHSSFQWTRVHFPAGPFQVQGIQNICSVLLLFHPLENRGKTHINCRRVFVGNRLDI